MTRTVKNRMTHANYFRMCRWLQDSATSFNAETTCDTLADALVLFLATPVSRKQVADALKELGIVLHRPIRTAEEKQAIIIHSLVSLYTALGQPVPTLLAEISK